jgi:hypothetical protein
LRERGAKFRIDPVLEPIGFGFAPSLGRYLEARRRWPDVEIMMGIGNLTELTEVDSAGLNLLLAGFCQELAIRSVLTTQVINWCRSAVREFDLARRLAYHAIRNQSLPKHVDSRLVLLRDPKLREVSIAELDELAAGIKDPNFRIFAERGELHVINRDGHRQGADPFELFEQLGPLDPVHAFYLGYEMAKAVTALTLGKNYRQDEPLRWGFLTRPEVSARHRQAAAREAEDERDHPELDAVDEEAGWTAPVLCPRTPSQRLLVFRNVVRIRIVDVQRQVWRRHDLLSHASQRKRVGIVGLGIPPVLTEEQRARVRRLGNASGTWRGLLGQQGRHDAARESNRHTHTK